MEKLGMFNIVEASELEQKMECCMSMIAACSELVVRGLNTPKSYDNVLSGCYFFLEYITSEFSSAITRANDQTTT